MMMALVLSWTQLETPDSVALEEAYGIGGCADPTAEATIRPGIITACDYSAHMGVPTHKRVTLKTPQYLTTGRASITS